MKSVGDYILDFEQLLMMLFLGTFAVKTVLYFSYEKYWDSLRFFHYSKIDLKMTSIRHLRLWRKRQNKMSTAMGVFLCLFAMVYLFHQIVTQG